jgi:hypothetical protein
MRTKSLSAQIKAYQKSRRPRNWFGLASARNAAPSAPRAARLPPATDKMEMAPRPAPSPSPAMLGLYEAQLRSHGSVTLSRANAEAFLAARALVVRPHPTKPGLVWVERNSTSTQPE